VIAEGIPPAPHGACSLLLAYATPLSCDTLTCHMAVPINKRIRGLNSDLPVSNWETRNTDIADKRLACAWDDSAGDGVRRGVSSENRACVDRSKQGLGFVEVRGASLTSILQLDSFHRIVGLFEVRRCPNRRRRSQHISTAVSLNGAWLTPTTFDSAEARGQSKFPVFSLAWVVLICQQ